MNKNLNFVLILGFHSTLISSLLVVMPIPLTLFEIIPLTVFEIEKISIWIHLTSPNEEEVRYFRVFEIEKISIWIHLTSPNEEEVRYFRLWP
jgi:hypothetical protein